MIAPTIPDIRIIKKYPNRRLYDTSISQYICLQDIHKLVLDNVPFCVIDSKTETDITRSVLLQVIAEQELNDDSPVFSNELLSFIVRFHGDYLAGMLGNYLEQAVKVFVENQDKLMQEMLNFEAENPIETITTLADEQFQYWLKKQQGKEPAGKDEA